MFILSNFLKIFKNDKKEDSLARSRTLNISGSTNRVLKLRTLALLEQCLTMLNSKAICNCVRTTILHNYLKSLSSGKSRNRVMA